MSLKSRSGIFLLGVAAGCCLLATATPANAATVPANPASGPILQVNIGCDSSHGLTSFQGTAVDLPGGLYTAGTYWDLKTPSNGVNSNIDPRNLPVSAMGSLSTSTYYTAGPAHIYAAAQLVVSVPKPYDTDYYSQFRSCLGGGTIALTTTRVVHKSQER